MALTQARLFTGQQAYLDEVERQLRDWIEKNPYARGMQWVSALEVAFRFLSWLWVWHLAGSELSSVCRHKLVEAMWRHCVFFERNLSVYFSPSTHLLGEAVALHALGRLFPGLPHAARWRELGRRVTREEMDHQIRDAGPPFAQSWCYHVYACDFSLFHALL